MSPGKKSKELRRRRSAFCGGTAAARYTPTAAGVRKTLYRAAALAPSEVPLARSSDGARRPQREEEGSGGAAIECGERVLVGALYVPAGLPWPEQSHPCPPLSVGQGSGAPQATKAAPTAAGP